jgi:dihydrofolate reductase
MVTAIACMGSNRVIGNQGGLPWHIPAELKHFKATTKGHVLIMGRATFDSVGVLPGRAIAVISKSPSWFFSDKVSVFSNVKDAVSAYDGRKIFIAGGQSIYQQAFDLGIVDKVLLSVLPDEYEGDRTFPSIPTYLRLMSQESTEWGQLLAYER